MFYDVSTQTSEPDNRTPQAKRQAVHRALKALPREAEQFASTLERLHDSATPRNKIALEKRGFVAENCRIGSFVITAVNDFQKKTDVSSRQKRNIFLDVYRKYGSIARRCKILKMNRKTIRRHQKDRVNQRQKRHVDTVHEVSTFLESEAVTLPDKKLVSRKTGLAKSVLQKPLEELHKKYQETGGQASFSMFAKCRPQHVRRMIISHLDQCLCEDCGNCRLKILTVNRIAGIHCRIRSVYHAVALSTCEEAGKDCAYRKCPNCSVGKLEDYLAPIKTHEGEVTWHRWSNKKIVFKGKEVSRKVLETRKGSVGDLLEELLVEVEFISGYLYVIIDNTSSFRD